MADEVTSVEEDQAARAARIARLRELKEHADACGLPLVYTIEHEGPNGGKQDGLMTAGSGRLQLRAGAETVLACALGGVDKVEAPRMSGRRIDITAGGAQHKVWLKDFVPTEALGPSDDDVDVGIGDQSMAVADAGGAGDAAEAIDSGLALVGGAVSALSNRAERKEWIGVIEGRSSPEEMAAECLDKLLEYEVDADQIYRDEGL